MKVGAIVGAFSGLSLIFFLILALISGFCWDYMFSHWLPYLGKENNIPFWVCMVMGFVPVVGQLSVPGWFVTFVLFSFVL